MFGLGTFSTAWRDGLARYSHAMCYGALAASLLAHCVDVALIHRFVSICVLQPWLRQRLVRQKEGGNVPSSSAEELWSRVTAGSPDQLSALPPKALLFLSEFVHEAKVTTRDCDLMGHMNNARYPREADFARHELFVECGLFDVCWKGKMPLVTAAQSIRYRRELKFGTRYQIRTRIVGWDGSSLYVQQTFCARSPNTGEAVVHAVLIVKESVAVGAKRKASLPHPLTEAMTRLGWLPPSPISDALMTRAYLPPTAAPPHDVAVWASSLLETSSRVNDALPK